MNISEYASKHGLKPQLISSYIKRHSEEFEGHTRKEVNSIVLDDVAIALLDKKYPYPLELVGIPKEEHEKLQKELDFTKALLTQSQKDLAEQIQINLEYQKLLKESQEQLKALEDKQKNKAEEEADEWLQSVQDTIKKTMEDVDREKAERERQEQEIAKKSLISKVFSKFMR